jgi:hypothetical protein
MIEIESKTEANRNLENSLSAIMKLVCSKADKPVQSHTLFKIGTS